MVDVHSDFKSFKRYKYQYSHSYTFFIIFSTEKYESKLYTKVKIDQKPIIYDDIYNISFCGLEKLHPFDSGKWGKIVTILIGMSIAIFI